MIRRLLISITMISMIPAIIFAQGLNIDNFRPSIEHDMLMGQLKYANEDDLFIEDSVSFDYEKSPGKAFLLSALIPGAGEFYAGSKYKALGFLGAEALFWTMYFNKKSEGEDGRIKFEKYADTHWDFNEWLNRSVDDDWISQGYGPGGSHNIYAVLKIKDENDNWVAEPGTEFAIDKGYSTIYDSLESAYGSVESIIEPIKTRDYYENIGKYHQFAMGWDDFGDFNETSDTLLMNDNRNNYLNQRKDSNDALKMATNFGTAIIFNHLISAIHAQILAKHYKSDGKLSWNLNLITDVRRREFVRGLNLSISF